MSEIENNTVNNSSVTGDYSLLVRLNKKILFYHRIVMLAVIGIFLVAIFSAYILVPKAEAALDQVNGMVARVESSLDLLDEMSNGLKDMSDSMTDTSEDLNKLVEENGTALSETMKSISEIDFEGLNKAIKDLQDTVGPLASFFGRFN
jgi:methyl-accepting chemotaxis protein